MYQRNTMLYHYVALTFLVLPFLEFGDVMALSDQNQTTASPTCIYDEIPQFLPTECTTLTIRNGNFGELSSTTLSHLNGSNILTLTISDNGITAIEINAMESFPALQHLDASDNLIERLDSGVFQSLHELTNLNLHSNKISSISNSAFEGLENLRVLRLDNNQLSDIDSSFSDVAKLETLNLTFNDISEISSNTFDGSTKLHYLFLAYNRFSEIPEALTGNPIQKLYVLNLRSNLINTTLTSSHLHHDYLEELYLTNNDIPDLSDDAFKYLRRLQVLHLDYNRLTDFDAWLVQHPQELREIKLDHNPWDCNCSDFQVWDELPLQPNLEIIEQNATFCVTPSSRRGEVVFDLATSCENGPLISTEALKGIIAASALIFTALLIIACICCCRNTCQRSSQPGKETSESQVEQPHHEYLSHAASPKNVRPAIPSGQTGNGKLVAGNSSALRPHIYDLPDVTATDVDNYLVPMNMVET